MVSKNFIVSSLEDIGGVINSKSDSEKSVVMYLLNNEDPKIAGWDFFEIALL